MQFTKLLDAIKEYFDPAHQTGKNFDKIVMKQYKSWIRTINKSLKESLKADPEGYAKVTIELDSPDLLKALGDFYEKHGYKVSYDEYYGYRKKHLQLTIEFINWYKGEKDESYK